MEKKNTESSEHISSNEVDEIVESEPKKEFDDLVGSDDDEVDELTEEEIMGKEDPPDTDEEEKENDSL